MSRSPIPAAELRAVVSTLKSWSEIRYQLREKEDDAYLSGYCTDFEARRTGRPGNPTQSRALRKVGDPDANWLQWRNDALEEALVRIGGARGKKSPHAWAMTMHYLGNNPWRLIAERIGVSERTLHRWRDQFTTYVWQGLRRK